MGREYLKQYCYRKHDTYMVGRNSVGTCVQCIRDSVRNAYHRNKHKDPIKKLWKSRDRTWKQQGIKVSSGRFFNYLDYHLAFEQQKGLCLICKKHQSEFKKMLCVDHDHKTGLFRGIVCNQCNFDIGAYERQKNQEIKKYLDACLIKVDVTPKEVADQRLAVIK